MKSHYTMRLPQWAKDLKQSPSDFEVKRQVKEVVRVLCSACKGKKVVSRACNDCRRRGKAVDKLELFTFPEPELFCSKDKLLPSFQTLRLTPPCFSLIEYF